VNADPPASRSLLPRAIRRLRSRRQTRGKTLLVVSMFDDQSCRRPSVGITFTKARLTNPRRADAAEIEIEFLVDSGAIFSVVPGSILDALGVSRKHRQEFTLADGTHVTYDVGEVTFAVGDLEATSRVVFAPEGVTPLLGALTLESLALILNPVTRELLPMRLFLARAG
jgi:clan AA aspartic protease